MGRRELGAHQTPVQIQLFREDHRKGRQHPLPHLGGSAAQHESQRG